MNGLTKIGFLVAALALAGCDNSGAFGLGGSSAGGPGSGQYEDGSVDDPTSVAHFVNRLATGFSLPSTNRRSMKRAFDASWAGQLALGERRL